MDKPPVLCGRVSPSPLLESVRLVVAVVAAVFS